MLHRRSLAALLAPLAITALWGAAPATAATTAVSLEFDDGRAEVYSIARSMLQARGLKATIYVNSALVGTPGYMTWDQIDALARDGHEIGGHTRTHGRLSSMTAREQVREICDDRQTLLDRGYEARTMALPFGDFDYRTQAIVAGCGYNAARGVGGLSGGVDAETIPPRDAYLTRTPGSVMSTMAPNDLRSMVTRAEKDGGWVQMTFHRICDACDDYAITRDDLAGFLDWVGSRASRGTAVVRATDVIGGPARPVAASPLGRRSVVNPSLEQDADGDLVPDCWESSPYGDNAATVTLTSDALAGRVAHRIDMTRYVDGDQKLIVRRDAACAPAITPGRVYTISAWTKGTAKAAFIAFYRTRGGDWRFLTQTPIRPGLSTWSPESFDVVAPADAAAISFGITALGTGTLYADAFDLEDAQQPFASVVRNGSLEEDRDGDGMSDCFEAAGYGTNSWTTIRTSDAFAGATAQRLDVHSISSGDRKILVRRAECAVAVEPGRSYSLSTRYRSTVPTMLVSYYLDANGAWQVFSTRDRFPAAPTWAPAEARTDPLPAGARALTWGLAIEQPGSVTTDAYFAGDLP